MLAITRILGIASTAVALSADHFKALFEHKPQKMKSEGTPCSYWYKDSFYDLVDENLNVFFQTSGMAQRGTVPVNMYFSLCEALSTTNSPCSGDYFAAFTSNGGPCKPMTTSSLTSITQTSMNYTAENGTEVETFALFYTDPTDAGQEQLRVGLICDPSVTTPVVSELKFRQSLGECTLTAASVCAVITPTALSSFVEQYSYVWGAFSLTIGAFLTFFGRKLYPLAMFLAGIMATTYTGVLFVYYVWLDDNYENWVGWTTVSVSVVVGAIVGLIFAKFIRAGACLLGGFGGYIFGLLLNELFVYYSKTYVLFWIVIAVFTVVGFVCGYLFWNNSIILSSAFMGAYIFCRGISMFAGGWTNEYTLIKDIEYGAIDHVSKWVYLYFAGMVVLSVLGALVQRWHFGKLDYDQKHPYKSYRINTSEKSKPSEISARYTALSGDKSGPGEETIEVEVDE